MDIKEKITQTKQLYTTLAQLREAILSGEYHESLPYFSRSFTWKSTCQNSYDTATDHEEYFKLDPVPTEAEISNIKTELEKNETILDPLNANGNSETMSDARRPSKREDPLDVIKVDVDRLLLDPIFQNDKIKDDIIEILYNYDHFTPYKQGYHEIAGMVYLTLHRDQYGLMTREEIKSTCFQIFTNLMLPVVPHFYHEDHLIGWCVSVFNRYLLLIDPPLYELIIKYHHIESQIWLIRWVRLLFLREIGLPNTLKLMDHLLAYDQDITKLIPYLIAILLIRIKMSLVECEDQGELLYLLLHYPYLEYNCEEITEMVNFAIAMCECSDDSKLVEIGVKVNKRYHQGFKWEKVKDLGKLRLELKLKRRVRGVLGK